MESRERGSGCSRLRSACRPGLPGAVLGIASLLAGACNPAAVRPNYLPFPTAAIDTVDAATDSVMVAGLEELSLRGWRISRFSVRQGYLETDWFDLRDGSSHTSTTSADSVIQIRIWSDLIRRGQSEIRIETVYRASLDPSLPERETLAQLEPGQAGYELTRELIEAIKENVRR